MFGFRDVEPSLIPATIPRNIYAICIISFILSFHHLFSGVMFSKKQNQVIFKALCRTRFLRTGFFLKKSHISKACATKSAQCSPLCYSLKELSCSNIILFYETAFTQLLWYSLWCWPAIVSISNFTAGLLVLEWHKTYFWCPSNTPASNSLGKTGMFITALLSHRILSHFSPVTHFKSSVSFLPSRSQKPFRQLGNPIGEHYGHCSSTCWRMPNLGGLCALYICTVVLVLMYNAFTCLAKDIII